MAKKDRFPAGYSTGFAPNVESEGSGSSGRIDAAMNVPGRKWISLNSTSRDGFSVPTQVVPLSRLTSYERKTLVLRLKSELEQIRLLQRKVESQRANAIAVSSSSDILSCSNVQKQLPVSNNIMKPSGPGSALGKKLGSSSQKGRGGWNRSTSGRFQSSKLGSGPNPYAGLIKQCEGLLKKLMTHEYAWVFNDPVDIVKLNIPDYYTVIKHPMDLGTIKKKLTKREYESPQEFAADVRLTFANAMTYNPPGNDAHVMANAMNKFFEVRWKTIEKKLPVENSQSFPEKSELHEEIEIIKPVPPSKKRKLTPTPPRVIPEPVRRVMTDAEKQNLSRELEDQLGDLPDNIIDFLRAQSSNGGQTAEDEIEIDIDDLSDDTLFTLRKLLDDHLKEKQKNHTSAEPCEIELPNEPGLSNSSMQLEKETGPVDEDVDIGGNEPPVSSYPPVEIDKDIGQGGNQCTSEGNLRDSDSGYSSGDKPEHPKVSSPVQLAKSQDSGGVTSEPGEKAAAQDLVDVNYAQESLSGLDQLEQIPQDPSSMESDGHQDGDSAPSEKPVSPDKLYRAALLKNRFADTILKAREKTLGQVEKGDPEKLRREREELEMQRRREKARLQAEARAAEDARKRAEAEAAAEARKMREREREAARQALLEMEKTVEINENSRILEDLEMLRRTAAPDQLPSSVDETSPGHSQDGLGSFKFGGGNALEQLGLYMKMDDEEEEGDAPIVPKTVDDVEEGEID